MMQNEDNSEKNRTALEQEQEREKMKQQESLATHNHSDRMVIESSDSQLLMQSSFQISETERTLLNEALYYTGNAYRRVMETFEDCVWVLRSGQGSLDNAFLMLDGLIQNAYIQFESYSKEIPEKLSSTFQQTFEDMKKDSKRYHSQLPEEFQKILETHFHRLETLLNREKVELPAYPKVTNIDPEKILPLFNVMQSQYTQQERDLKKISEDPACIVVPEFNSGTNYSSEFSLI